MKETQGMFNRLHANLTAAAPAAGSRRRVIGTLAVIVAAGFGLVSGLGTALADDGWDDGGFDDHGWYDDSGWDNHGLGDDDWYVSGLYHGGYGDDDRFDDHGGIRFDDHGGGDWDDDDSWDD